ncbi:thioredoxin domain-containing protein [Sulfurimonas sp.]|nr:thioredoxin domain-containing protein [Sulfurimonas sp.]
MESLKVVCPECSSVSNVKQESQTAVCSSCQADLDDPFPLEVTDASCTIHIEENDIPILVDFYSKVCGPCMAMYDDYEDAALGFPMKVRFLKIDADKHQEVARKYGVSALPTIIAFKNGEEVNRISSQLSQIQLSLWAQDLI